MWIRPWMWPGVVAGGRATMWIRPWMWPGVVAGSRDTMWIRPWMWPGVVAGSRATMWIRPWMWPGVVAGSRVTMWIRPWMWLGVVAGGRVAKGTALYFHLPYLELKQASFPLGSFCRLLCHTVPLLSPPQKTCGLCVCWIKLPLPVFPHQPVCPEIPFSASEQIFLVKKSIEK